ncbi:zinc finger protein 121-like isoform X3 [Bombus impatiens]|uniref:Zinc finger protein 121-like isoform X3 n=1 Tax=Bombus impatiens TaxID=132113 RepID=A0A6P3DTW7_BOMIM|nr:zinc finger protein 121-like isoform X3 [Bombus impatiens]
MDSEGSVILESCGEHSILIQTVKDMVNVNTHTDLQSEEGGFFVVTDVQDEQQNVIEVSNEQSTVGQSDVQFSWSNLCRICANVNDHLIPIFEGEGLQHDLCNKIHKYLPICVSENDALPLQLCYHCAATLLAWHELLEGCLNAERRLLEMQDALQEKQGIEGLETSTQDATSAPNVTESLHQQQETVKDEVSGNSAVNDSDRSGSMRTPFKVFLDMQNVFRKPYRKKFQLQERKPTDNGDCDSVWITVMNSTLDQPTIMSNQLQDNDVTIKEEVSQIYNSDSMEKLKLDDETYKLTDSSNAKNGSKKVKGRCKICSNNSKDSKDSCEHIKNKAIIDVQESYQCVECGKCFKLKDSFLRHMRIHTDERPFTCHVCGKQFRDSGGLSRHLKDVHAKLKNFTCDICGKSFASKATREDHRRTHTGERPYVCDSCGKTFKSKASLYIHSKLHTDEFPHPCSYCNKKFRRRQEMLAHVTTHTGEKNHGCDVCSKRFRVKSELVRHKLIHSETKPFVCVECGLAFRQKRYLNNHIKSRHIETLRAC